jgi:hypothetical protein
MSNNLFDVWPRCCHVGNSIRSIGKDFLEQKWYQFEGLARRNVFKISKRTMLKRLLTNEIDENDSPRLFSLTFYYSEVLARLLPGSQARFGMVELEILSNSRDCHCYFSRDTR